MTRNLEPVFPRRLVQGKREMRDILTTRITNYRTQQSASGEAFQVVNGCAAHYSGQVLTLQGKTGSPFREITNTLPDLPGHSTSLHIAWTRRFRHPVLFTVSTV